MGDASYDDLFDDGAFRAACCRRGPTPARSARASVAEMRRHVDYGAQLGEGAAARADDRAFGLITEKMRTGRTHQR